MTSIRRDRQVSTETVEAPVSKPGPIAIEASLIMQAKVGWAQYKRDNGVKDSSTIEITPGSPTVDVDPEMAVKTTLGLISLYDATFVSELSEQEKFERAEQINPNIAPLFVDYTGQRELLARQLKEMGRITLKTYPDEAIEAKDSLPGILQDELKRFDV